jgi:hypothetical protein
VFVLSSICLVRVMEEKRLGYEVDEKKRAVKVFYSTPLTKKEREKHPSKASSLHKQAEDLALSIFKENFSNSIPVSKTINSLDRTPLTISKQSEIIRPKSIISKDGMVVYGVEVYDGVLHGLDLFVIVEESMKKNEYEDFIKFFPSEEKPYFDPKDLPGALKYPSNLQELGSAKKIINDLHTQARLGGEGGKAAKELLAKISKAQIPQQKRGVNP